MGTAFSVPWSTAGRAMKMAMRSPRSGLAVSCARSRCRTVDFQRSGDCRAMGRSGSHRRLARVVDPRRLASERIIADGLAVGHRLIGGLGAGTADRFGIWLGNARGRRSGAGCDFAFAWAADSFGSRPRVDRGVAAGCCAGGNFASAGVAGVAESDLAVLGGRGYARSAPNFLRAGAGNGLAPFGVTCRQCDSGIERCEADSGRCDR